MTGIAAIVLAAGRGTRFGSEAKMLAQLDGRPLVRRAADTAVRAGMSPVLVVVGHRHGEVGTALEGSPVEIVQNRRFAEGLSTSLQAGFGALPPDAEAAIVLLGDMPGVSSRLVADLAAAWREVGRPAALIPTYGDRRGNPVVLSIEVAPDIAGLDGDEGAGRMLRGRPGVVEWPVVDPGILLDVDTPEALAQVRTTTWSTAE